MAKEAAASLMNPRIFISSVTREFGAIRRQVAEVARQLGYDTVTMDDWSLAEGELLAWLRTQINRLFPALRSSPTSVQEPPAKSKFLAVDCNE